MTPSAPAEITAAACTFVEIPKPANMGMFVCLLTLLTRFRVRVSKLFLAPVTPSTFITEESFQPEVADIPIYIPLKNITIQTSKNFKYDLLRFTLNIKIKNF